jgi:hypothetical protein
MLLACKSGDTFGVLNKNRGKSCYLRASQVTPLEF